MLSINIGFSIDYEDKDIHIREEFIQFNSNKFGIPYSNLTTKKSELTFSYVIIIMIYYEIYLIEIYYSISY